MTSINFASGFAKRIKRMQWRTLLVSGVLGLGLGLGPLPAAACQLERLQLQVADPLDAADVCVGVGRALTFFAEYGLDLRQPVRLEVRPSLPSDASNTAAGVFMPDQSLIYMLSFSSFRKFRNWFNLSITREVYQSLAAHEVAHAITNAHFRIDRPSVHAREYLAYVALFATMPAKLRRQALAAMPGQGFEDEQRLSLPVYLMDPMFFGAQSYRHFLHLSPAQRSAFFQALLAGEALTD